MQTKATTANVTPKIKETTTGVNNSAKFGAYKSNTNNIEKNGAITTKNISVTNPNHQVSVAPFTTTNLYQPEIPKTANYFRANKYELNKKKEENKTSIEKEKQKSVTKVVKGKTISNRVIGENEKSKQNISKTFIADPEEQVKK